MKSSIHILHLEDDPNDAALIQATLMAADVTCTTTCVQTEDAFVAALEQGGIDLILADYTLPEFNGLSALKIALIERPGLPVILVSGTLGEDQAVDSLKSGATDYVLKDRLFRLAPAVRRAMQQVKERTQTQQFDARASLRKHLIVPPQRNSSIIPKLSVKSSGVLLTR